MRWGHSINEEDVTEQQSPWLQFKVYVGERWDIYGGRIVEDFHCHAEERGFNPVVREISQSF